MKCPYCGKQETDVIETRDSEDLTSTRRRRECRDCGKRFTTYERVERVALIVIKKDQRREEFDRHKLKAGIFKACAKTTLTNEDIERVVNTIEKELRGLDSVEIESRKIGEMVARELKKLDKIAYIRFASVFKNFVDVEDFERELKKLL